jgi:hypothetical protein
MGKRGDPAKKKHIYLGASPGQRAGVYLRRDLSSPLPINQRTSPWCNGAVHKTYSTTRTPTYFSTSRRPRRGAPALYPRRPYFLPSKLTLLRAQHLLYNPDSHVLFEGKPTLARRTRPLPQTLILLLSKLTLCAQHLLYNPDSHVLFDIEPTLARRTCLLPRRPYFLQTFCHRNLILVHSTCSLTGTHMPSKLTLLRCIYSLPKMPTTFDVQPDWVRCTCSLIRTPTYLSPLALVRRGRCTQHLLFTPDVSVLHFNELHLRAAGQPQTLSAL